MYNQPNHHKPYNMHRDHSRDYRERSREKNRRDRSSQHNDRERRRKRSRSHSNEKWNEPSRHDRSYRDSRSNSRQRERKQSHPESYPQRQAQQLQQRLRIAIRNNQIHFDAKLLQALRNMPISRQQQLKYQADSVEKIHECILVRQLFISGLEPSKMNEPYIEGIMKQYGQIEKIQIVKNFAYVKFHKVQDASNACAEYHTINMSIYNSHNPTFKIFFADHIKRWNVVSNSANYENTQELVPVVYASIRNQPPFNSQTYLKEVFQKFGFIRNLQLKIPDQKPYKTFILVQYETMTQALRARERIRVQRQKYLGDRKSQVTLLLDSEKVTRLHPNVKNQVRYFMKRQQNISTASQPQISRTINPFLQHIEPVKPGLHQLPQAPDSSTDIFAIIRELTEKQQEHDQEESDWVGFLTRKKQFKVQVDFNLIHKVPFELESILNVSHRGSLEEGVTREDYVMAGKFKASNSLNVDAFNNYINYFIKKNRAGIIQSNNYLIYLLPPKEGLALPYPTKPDEILALFFKL